MRLFEITLLITNLLVIFLGFKKPSKAVWLGAGGVSLATLLLHAIFEGFRWQMSFSYALVVLLLIYVLAKTIGRIPSFKIPKALKITASSLGIMLVALTATLAYVLPVFTLPKPTGSDTVGVTYFPMTDDSRTEPFLAGSKQKREIMVKAYYPAKADNSKPFVPYFNGSSELMQAYAKFYHLPSFAFNHFGLTKTQAKYDLAVSDTAQTYPVVLFSNGAGATMEVETTQSEELASHGYIVIDIDHTYVSAATVFPDRTVLGEQATTDFNVPEPAEPITQIMADDQKFVINKLADVNEGKMSPRLQGKLDLNKIGVIGHSVGGAAAYNMAIHDNRVKAAVNLDGAAYIQPGDPSKMAPMLMLANDKYHVQAIQKRENLMMKFDESPESQQMLRDLYGSREAYDKEYLKAQQYITGLADTLKASGNLYTIEGSDHMKFTDIGLYIGSKPLREFLQIGGATDPARCLIITNALTVAFFDQHLKGSVAHTPESLTKTYPELKKVSLD